MKDLLEFLDVFMNRIMAKLAANKYFLTYEAVYK